MRLLSFLNLVDKDGALNIPVVFVFCFLIKLFFAPFEWTDAACFLVSAALYAYFKEQTKADAELFLEIGEELKNVKDELDSFKAELLTHKELHDLVAKQAEETKKLLSTQAVNTAFGGRR